ncbi:MAG: hypothetical protein QM755_03200 [Luteolibacter sp.]
MKWILWIVPILMMNLCQAAPAEVEFALGSDMETLVPKAAHSRLTEEPLCLEVEPPEGTYLKFYKIKPGCYLSVCASKETKKITSITVWVIPKAPVNKMDKTTFGASRFKMNQDGSFELTANAVPE